MPVLVVVQVFGIELDLLAITWAPRANCGVDVCASTRRHYFSREPRFTCSELKIGKKCQFAAAFACSELELLLFAIIEGSFNDDMVSYNSD